MTTKLINSNLQGALEEAVERATASGCDPVVARQSLTDMANLLQSFPKPQQRPAGPLSAFIPQRKGNTNGPHRT